MATVRRSHWLRGAILLLVFLTPWLILNVLSWSQPVWADGPENGVQQADPTPTIDRLAEPELPDNPTQADLGRLSYYHNCMPCHGDKGQGLTDEWREVWVDDHQDCWARGCHGGRPDEEGFPIPTIVPAVSGSSWTLHAFSTPQELYNYLHDTHPPQHPGILEDEDYWTLTAYLFAENGRLSPDDEIGPEPTATAVSQSATQPGILADTQPESQLESQAEIQPELQSEIQPEARYDYIALVALLAIVLVIVVLAIWSGRR